MPLSKTTTNFLDGKPFNNFTFTSMIYNFSQAVHAKKSFELGLLCRNINFTCCTYYFKEQGGCQNRTIVSCKSSDRMSSFLSENRSLEYNLQFCTRLPCKKICTRSMQGVISLAIILEKGLCNTYNTNHPSWTPILITFMSLKRRHIFLQKCLSLFLPDCRVKSCDDMWRTVINEKINLFCYDVGWNSNFQRASVVFHSTCNCWIHILICIILMKVNHTWW